MGPHVGPYSYAKQQQEDVCHYYARERGARVTIARPANVIGAESAPWLGWIVPMLQAGIPLIVDEGKGNAGLIHARDVASALLLLALSEDTVGEAYNLCAEYDISWAQYFDDLADA